MHKKKKKRNPSLDLGILPDILDMSRDLKEALIEHRFNDLSKKNNEDQKKIAPSFTDYPWRIASTEIHSNLIKWLYLPDFAKKPDAKLLLCENSGGSEGLFTLRTSDWAGD